jgi:putative ABC transport system permease protein
VWTITLRDLQYRRRQFGIAVIGAGMLFALTLAITGAAAGFYSEAHSALDSVGADAWVVGKGVSGPFTSPSVVDPSSAAQVQGAQTVDPVIIKLSTMTKGSGFQGVGFIGHRIGGLGAPPPAQGRAPERPGEAVVDSSLGAGIGSQIVIEGHPLTVTGLVHGKTYNTGIPLIYGTLEDGQALAFGGRPLASALITRGTPSQVPAGLVVLSNRQVFVDLTRPTANARKTLGSTRLFMWAVGAVIIGAVTYLSALERVRDFAVLKAVGAAGRTLVASVVIEAVLAALAAAILGMALSQVVVPMFAPLRIDITTVAYAALPVVAVIMGILASLVAVRRVMNVDPALAFG